MEIVLRIYQWLVEQLARMPDEAFGHKFCGGVVEKGSHSVL